MEFKKAILAILSQRMVQEAVINVALKKDLDQRERMNLISDKLQKKQE